jgi:hypothetical protein
VAAAAHTLTGLAIYFLQGAPIQVRHSGRVYKLGTVCVLDRAPRANFSVRDKQVSCLHELKCFA